MLIRTHSVITIRNQWPLGAKCLGAASQAGWGPVTGSERSGLRSALGGRAETCGSTHLPEIARCTSLASISPAATIR